jgi:hypothetical protein
VQINLLVLTSRSNQENFGPNDVTKVYPEGKVNAYIPEKKVI